METLTLHGTSIIRVSGRSIQFLCPPGCLDPVRKRTHFPSQVTPDYPQPSIYNYRFALPAELQSRDFSDLTKKQTIPTQTLFHELKNKIHLLAVNLGDVRDKVEHAPGVTPLVIVPGDELDIVGV